MKNVIFMVINMNVGGTEKALLNRIEKMPKEKYNITILMLEEYGEFLKEVPAYVNIIFLEQYHALQHLINDPPKNVIVHHLKKGKLLSAFVLIYVYSLS